MLEIKNLNVKIKDKSILNNFNININKGEVHVIMGPNGAGKSTFANVVLNNPLYEKMSGNIIFEECDITNLETNKIAEKGIFMSFQTPIEIPGISTSNFIRYTKSKISNDNVNKLKFAMELEKMTKNLNMNSKLLLRDLNVGFSGGEKKKNEILQMLNINPKLAILDETDSGLDFDAVKVVSKGISLFKNDDNAIILITHNTNILKDIKVDYVHVLINGTIVETGDSSLLEDIKENGYSKYSEKVVTNG